jgi:hypothetical protein
MKKNEKQDTHHPTLSLRPNTKSMHASSCLRCSNPVNVAHSPPTDARGAAYRMSPITSGSFSWSFSSEEEPEPVGWLSLEWSGKRRENESGTAGAGKVPVSIA